MNASSLKDYNDRVVALITELQGPVFIGKYEQNKQVPDSDFIRLCPSTVLRSPHGALDIYVGAEVYLGSVEFLDSIERGITTDVSISRIVALADLTAFIKRKSIHISGLTDTLYQYRR